MIVDRLEEGFAVCEKENGSFVNIPLGAGRIPGGRSGYQSPQGKNGQTPAFHLRMKQNRERGMRMVSFLWKRETNRDLP